MADLYGPVVNHWRCYASYSVTESATSVTVAVSAAGIQAAGWGFELSSGVTTWLSCDGSSGYGTGGFSASNGSWETASLATGTFVVAKAKAARTASLSVATVNASGYMDGTSQTSASVKVPALASYAVTYDADGGSGAPASQVKWRGEALTLSGAVPVKAGCTFGGWATSRGGAAAYQPGAAYAGDAALALYAVWTADAAAPTVDGLRAYRCGADGGADGEGAYARVTATATAATGVLTSVEVERRAKGSTAWATEASLAPGVAAYDLAATVGGSLATGTAYEMRVTATDSGGVSTSATTVVTAAFRTIDVGNQGRTVAIGAEASDEDGLEVAMEARFSGGVYVDGVSVPGLCSQIETVVLSAEYDVRAWRSAAGVVTVASAGSTAIPAGVRWTQVSFGTLAEGWRPPYHVMSTATVGGVAGYLSVTSAGLVAWVRSTASEAASALYHSVTFVAAPTEVPTTAAASLALADGDGLPDAEIRD